ncbi:hypothetical protein K7G19_19765 [Cupriavidus sp. DB3]|uniref:hypothetical protein n=1 Tax=Cupriavidus sp. DB3 TaxID=2873259 RepID=UPI001CF34888|nr:hypothetical protein [Cupriavidus sp. DB3]MCA7085830.1 hypothetical protein [Cupriavidus sp. DB3]
MTALTEIRIMEIFCQEAPGLRPADSPLACIRIGRALEREVLARAEREMAGLRQMLDAERQRADNAVAVSNALQDKVSRAAPSGQQAEQECGSCGYTADPDCRICSPQQADPCPGCMPGGVCKTPECGRLKALQAEQAACSRCKGDGHTIGVPCWLCEGTGKSLTMASPAASLHAESVKEDAESLQRGVASAPPDSDTPFPPHWHALLEWNRRQPEPPIRIGREYDVARAHSGMIAPPDGDAERKRADAFVREFEDWVKHTGALPWGGSWMAEVSSIIERAAVAASKGAKA